MKDLLSTINCLSCRDDQERALQSELSRLFLRCADTQSGADELACAARMIWPAQLDDARVSTYIVPIEPRWARELFDEESANRSLLPTDPMLALRPENVYYRSARARIGTPFSRILWYVSQEVHDNGVSGLAAISPLEDVAVLPAKDAMRRFHRLGVYGWQDVLNVAHGNADANVQAYRFGRTMLFPRRVSFSGIQAVISKHTGKQAPPLSTAVEIPPACFRQLFELGTATNGSDKLPSGSSLNKAALSQANPSRLQDVGA